jgi:ATPase subunit of ABC transporter with duplicated ATPase domains
MNTGATSPRSAVIISRDLWFLDRISPHILVFEGDSHVEWFEGEFRHSGEINSTPGK